MAKNHYPLVVDLDGTLVHSDLFVEAFLLFVQKNPFRIFITIYWFFKKGRTYLKLQLEKRVELNMKFLPWNKGVISWVKNEKEKGRTLVLVTGTSQKYAEQVAEHLNLFAHVYGVCRARPRLTGQNKARFLYSLYGFKKFDYIANSIIDYRVWRIARHCIVAHAYPFVVWRARKLFHVIHVISKNKNFSQIVENLFSTMKVIHQKLPFMNLLIRVLLFWLPVFFYNGFFLSHRSISGSSISLILHGSLVGGLLIFSAFIWGELRNLYQNRMYKYGSLFSYIHTYWGITFIPAFWLGIGYALFTLPFYVGFVGALIYFCLESIRFLFMKKSYLYELLVFIYIYLWGYALLSL